MRDNRPLWGWTRRLKSAVGVGDAFICLFDDLRSLTCMDAESGHVRWTVELDGQGDPPLGMGLPYVSVVPERALVVVTNDGRILRLELGSGEVQAEGRGARRWAFAVTDTEVVYGSIAGMLAVDHRSTREVERQKWGSEVAEAYGGAPASCCGVYASRRCLVWTTLSGRVVGASRNAAAHGTRVWSDALPNAFFSVGSSPIPGASYLYALPATELTETMGLYCYASAVE